MPRPDLKGLSVARVITTPLTGDIDMRSDSDKLKVFADVMSPYLKIRNETRTAAAGKGKTVSVPK